MMANPADAVMQRAVVWSIAPQPVGEGQATKTNVRSDVDSFLYLNFHDLWEQGRSSLKGKLPCKLRREHENNNPLADRKVSARVSLG